MRALALCAILYSTGSAASQYDALINAAAQRHGVDPVVLRSIVQVETQKHPWSFNVDGEGFKYSSKAEAVNALYRLNQIPWMVKIRPVEGSQVRRFFPTQHSASAFYSAYQQQQAATGKPQVRLNTDNGKSVDRGEARIRKLWMLNTDIGIAQINYRYFGDGRPVQHWFDPSYNLDFAASLLAKHKRRTGSEIEAAGLYHSGTKKYRDRYMEKFMPVYNMEKNNAASALVTR